jgi:hypothetical protein
MLCFEKWHAFLSCWLQQLLPTSIPIETRKLEQNTIFRPYKNLMLSLIPLMGMMAPNIFSTLELWCRTSAMAIKEA